ncbi:M56 family metallopeptidase [Porphyromonas cangingivalis]|uniref:M56 family metallopeptidase n=1 Tax=Porphyromonas cangingivalis TaxID=36874 RepID=UPI0009DD882A|nr:M56 family metallopeptidase [Porphyromonas cangingivalis]
MTLTLMTYLLLSGLGLFIFSMADRLYLRRRLALPHQRLFYLSALVAAFITPWASMLYPHKLIAPAVAGAEAEVFIDTDLSMVAVEEVSEAGGLLSHLSMSDFLLVLWGVGVAVMIIRLIYGLLRVLTIIHGAERVSSPSGRRIYLTDKASNPFSFMGQIVLPRHIYEDERCRDLILSHEEAHCIQGHHYDLVMDQLCLIVHWWNPFAWMLTGAHYNTLEYLADSHVLDTGIDRKVYQRQLLESSLKIPAEFLSLSFSVYNLKKRIKMMNNNTTSNRPLQSLRMVSALVLVSAGLFVGSNVMAVPAPVSVTDIQEDYVPQAPPVKTDSDVLDSVEDLPVYKNGDDRLMKDIAMLIKYPKEAVDKNIQGRVIISFVVDEQGNVVEPQVARKVHPLLDEEALRVVSLLKYNPGKVDGKAVRCRMNIPIRFAIPVEKGKTTVIVQELDPSGLRTVDQFRDNLQSLLRSGLRPNDDNVTVKFRIVDGKAQGIEVKTTDEKVKQEVREYVKRQKFKPEENTSGYLHFSFDIDKKKVKGNDDVFDFLDEMPEHEGGEAGMMKHLSKEVVYPEEAVKKNIQGRVMVGFIVEKDGTLSNVKIMRGIDPLLDAEAVRVVKTLKFRPGKMNGKPVRCRFTVPINFRLNDSSKKTDNAKS